MRKSRNLLCCDLKQALFYILEGATQLQLQLLYKLLHEIATGFLPLRKEKYAQLKRAKGVLQFVNKHFSSPQKVDFFIKNDMKKPLLKLASFYKLLLYAIFHD